MAEGGSAGSNAGGSGGSGLPPLLEAIDKELRQIVRQWKANVRNLGKFICKTQGWNRWIWALDVRKSCLARQGGNPNGLRPHAAGPNRSQLIARHRETSQHIARIAWSVFADCRLVLFGC